MDDDATGADAAFASHSGVARERARALRDAGGVAPLVALLEKPKKGREGVTDGPARSRVSGEKSEKKKRKARKRSDGKRFARARLWKGDGPPPG